VVLLGILILQQLENLEFILSATLPSAKDTQSSSLFMRRIRRLFICFISSKIYYYNARTAAQFDLLFSQERSRKTFNEHRIMGDLSFGAVVMVAFPIPSSVGDSRVFTSLIAGPYKVTANLTNVNYRLQFVSNPSKTILAHIQRLKLFYPRPAKLDVSSVPPETKPETPELPPLRRSARLNPS